MQALVPATSLCARVTTAFIVLDILIIDAIVILFSPVFDVFHLEKLSPRAICTSVSTVAHICTLATSTYVPAAKLTVCIVCGVASFATEVDSPYLDVNCPMTSKLLFKS